MEEKKNHRFKLWLENKGISQSAFAKQANIDRQIINKAVNGRGLQLRNAKRIARHTGYEVSLEDLGHED